MKLLTGFFRKKKEIHYEEKLKQVRLMRAQLNDMFLFFGHSLPEDLEAIRAKVLGDACATEEMLEKQWHEHTREELLLKFKAIEDKLREYRILR